MDTYEAAKKFTDAGCELANPIGLFLGLYAATNGNPCTTGCAYYRGGNCPAYRAMKDAAQKKAAQQEPTETVRETAARLGISISEVRRRRAAGA